MWVIKIGGSLRDAPELAYWLESIAEHGAGRVVIVPGGGLFADQVRAAQRHWGFADAEAHHMALLAMEQYARLLIAIQPRLVAAAIEPEIHDALARGQVPVWFPARMIANEESIEPGWDVTSDSLAAWLAARLGAANLGLVKSIAPTPGSHLASGLSAKGVVDRRFPQFIAAGHFAVWWLGPSDYRYLSGSTSGVRPEAQITPG
ncbi:MAG: amino acid kinase family protein [Chromatiales bacterium]